MTMTTRPDGSRYPDQAEQNRVLADVTDPDAETGPGYDYNLTLGDLLVDVFVGRDLCEGFTGSHEDYESFEIAMLRRFALELQALNHAMATGCLTTDDHPADEITTEQACELLRGMARRMRAGAEIASRLRDARWGHPSFGGGEAFLAERDAKFRAEGAERKAAEAAEGPVPS